MEDPNTISKLTHLTFRKMNPENVISQGRTVVLFSSLLLLFIFYCVEKKTRVQITVLVFFNLENIKKDFSYSWTLLDLDFIYSWTFICDMWIIRLILEDSQQLSNRMHVKWEITALVGHFFYLLQRINEQKHILQSTSS